MRFGTKLELMRVCVGDLGIKYVGSRSWSGGEKKTFLAFLAFVIKNQLNLKFNFYKNMNLCALFCTCTALSSRYSSTTIFLVIQTSYKDLV